MPEPTEAFWVPHCEEPGCSLGAFEYTCPVCGRRTSDYDVWWLFDSLIVERNISQHDFVCEKCKSPLTVYYEQEEYETRVKAKAQT